METTLLVSVIAAVASLIGAGVAVAGATRARRSANTVNSLNHQIAVIDRDAEELRLAYREVTQLLGQGDSAAIYGGKLMSALEGLMACRAAGADVERAAQELQYHVTRRHPIGIDRIVGDIRKAYQESQTALDAERGVLFAEMATN